MITNRVTQEMLETELAYQNSLSKFVEASKQPFYAEGPKLFQRLATAINKFAELSDSLHFSASVEMTQELSSSELSELRAKRMVFIGEFFTEFKNYMSLYEEFLKTKYNADPSSNKLPFKHLDHFLKPTLSNSDSLLIQPLQRGPRYELLIRDVLKRDDELSDDAPNKLIPAARAQLEFLLDTTKTYLVEANKPEATPGYQFGDISRGLLRKVSEHYTFGDVSRGFARRAYSFWAKPSEAPVEIGTPALVSASSSSLPSTQIPSAEPAVKQTPPPLPPRDVSPGSTVSSNTSTRDNESDNENAFKY